MSCDTFTQVGMVYLQTSTDCKMIDIRCQKNQTSDSRHFFTRESVCHFISRCAHQCYSKIEAIGGMVQCANEYRTVCFLSRFLGHQFKNIVFTDRHIDRQTDRQTDT